MIAGTYNTGLVVLSVLIAIVASYAAFNLGERVSASSGQRRWAWLTSGAIAMGFAIWSMHYVGMLAFVLPVPVLYHVPTVILSLLAAVPGAAVALYIVSKKTMHRVNTAIAGLCLGGAIVAMHYIGMAAMRSTAMNHYRLSLVILSVVVAITFSSVAAWLAFRFGRFHPGLTWTKISGASLMGLGIASMHYTAMAAAYFVPGHTPPIRHTVEVSMLGAFGIGMTTLLLLGTVLVTLWWDRRLANERLLQEAARRSEQELRDVINTVPAHAWSALPDGNIAFVNQRWQQFIGLPPEDALGWNWEVVLHPDDRAKFVADWRAALKRGQPMETEVRVRRADGEYRCLLVRNVPLRNELGYIIKWYGTGLDIEDRKRTESLLAGEKRVLEMLAKGNSLAEILDALCRLVEEQASGVLASILLLDGDRLRHGGAPSLPKAYMDAIDGAVIGPSAGSCGTAAYRGEQVIVEDIAADPLWVDFRDLALPHSFRACWSSPVFSSQGKVIATFAMYYREPKRPSPRDQEIIEQITHLAGVAIERKLTQEALRRSEAYLAEAQKLTRTGSWVWDVKTRQATYLSDEWYRIYGLEPGSNARAWEQRLQRIHPEDRSKWQEAHNRAISERSDYEFEYRLLLPHGLTKYAHVVGHPVLNASGEVVQFMGTVTDITERKQAEQALRRSEAYLAEAQRLTHTGSWARDFSTYNVRYWSEETFRILGLDPQQGVPEGDYTFRLMHPEDRDRVEELRKKAMHEKVEFATDYRIVLPDGTLKHLHVIGHPVFDESGEVHEYVGTVVDITERKRAEEERQRLQQLEADLAHIDRVSMMGELAASLAHEIKQPIAAALMNAKTCMRWLMRDTPDVAEAREASSRMVNDTTRAAEIIDRVRSLYRRDTSKRELLDLNEIIREMIILLHDKVSRTSISIHSDLDPGLPPITADRVQLQQVLLNLMLNGIEAMKDVSGELTIGSQRTPDGQLQISVTDSGIGITSEQANKIFEAFFTTKPQGTGMGLSISRKIIESHGGRIWASAHSGRGTTFQFTLPADVTASSSSAA